MRAISSPIGEKCAHIALHDMRAISSQIGENCARIALHAMLPRQALSTKVARTVPCVASPMRDFLPTRHLQGEVACIAVKDVVLRHVAEVANINYLPGLGPVRYTTRCLQQQVASAV